MNAKELKTAIEEYSGCGVMAAPAIVSLWCAEKMGEEIGYDKAMKALLELNRELNRKGKCTIFPEFGSALFAEWRKL